MLVGQLCRVCCCDASVGASRLLKAYPALSPGPHAVPHERDQWQLAPEGHAISERGKMQVSHFVGPKVCISTIRFQRAGSREGRANGASVRAQEAPAQRGAAACCCFAALFALPQRLLYPVHASVCVQAAVELSKQLQQRIKQRGCCEEFVPNVDMLEQGKVGGWMDEAFVCLLERCGTCAVMLRAQGRRGGHGCFCSSAVCMVVRLYMLGADLAPRLACLTAPVS